MENNKKLIMSDLTQKQRDDAKICEPKINCEKCSCKIKEDDCICNYIVDSYGNVI